MRTEWGKEEALLFLCPSSAMSRKSINTIWNWPPAWKRAELPPGAVWSADDEGSEPESWVLDYEITRNDAEYLSVVLHLRQLSGNGEKETLSADTFLRGDEPRKITLSELLGTEESDGSTQPVDLVYDLIWEIVQVGMENVEGDYLDGLTLDSVRSALAPETDFYLDDNGNIVFFVEPGLLAGEIAGVLLYPFSPYELRGSAPEAGLRAYARRNVQISMALWKHSAEGLVFPALSSPRPPLGDGPRGLPV